MVDSLRKFEKKMQLSQSIGTFSNYIYSIIET